MFIFSVLWLLLGIVFAFLYRMVHKKIKTSGALSVKNIGKKDRIVRFFIGFGLVVIAFVSDQQPILLFFAGFSFFEAVFSWCGLYALIGKNTCPLD